MPSLYPREPAARAAAKAERSGEAVLQPGPASAAPLGPSPAPPSAPLVRRHVASPLPAPALTSVLLTPLAPAFVWQAGASDEHVRRDLAGLPGLLDEVDGLLERGVIGGQELGAADFQIGSSIRMLLAMEDVGQLVAGRPAQAFALRVVPDYPDVPAALPAPWLPPAT